MKIVKVNNSEILCNEDWQCMTEYISNYGWHFNEKLCNLAISLMTKNNQPLQSLTKTLVDDMLKEFNIKLVNNVGWDYIFVANMGKADYLGNSITDNKHLMLYVKDTIDDEDAGPETTLRRWCATMTANNHLIDWASAL